MHVRGIVRKPPPCTQTINILRRIRNAVSSGASGYVVLIRHCSRVHTLANTAYLEKHYKAIKEKELTRYILEKQKEGNLLTYDQLRTDSPFKHDLDDTETWFMHFRKVRPYDDGNEFEEFRTDPFNLRRLFYKDENEIQQVVLIPPGAKDTIKDELAHFNIREEFIYPDMDSVANEINEIIDRKEEDQ